VRKDALTAKEDVHVSDIIPMAVEARFPIVVTDEEGALKGIVTKSSVLSSLAE